MSEYCSLVKQEHAVCKKDCSKNSFKQVEFCTVRRIAIMVK